MFHSSTLVWEGGALAAGGELGVLAPAPTGGWPAATVAALILLGALDAVIAPVSLVFVWGWFRRANWSGWLGSAVLATVMLSAIAFAAVTVPSGVWRLQPAYTIEAILFAPIAVLVILYFRWLLRGQLPSRGTIS
ncbi:MAG: hypothetical protein WBR18_03160 [Anaerolineales bacterium]